MLFIFNYYIPQATGKKQQAFLRAIVRKPPAAPRLPGLAECFQIFWIISAIADLLTICLLLTSLSRRASREKENTHPIPPLLIF